ncbi:MAG: hypothetical protein IVW57_02625, partial [Ktedonobacterales bacterium]|nr:hypothetical protein [Ktedonobacterales bacterium]
MHPRTFCRAITPWLLALVLLIGPNSPLALFSPNSVAYAQGIRGTSTPRGDSGKLNRFGNYLNTLAKRDAQPRRVSQASAGGPRIAAGATQQPVPAIARPFRASMKPGTLALSPTSASSFTGSDGALRVDAPAGAVALLDQEQAGGALSLQITQIAGGSGASAGGSGHITLGIYLVQLLTKAGTRATLPLRKPITFTFSYGKRELALNLDKALLVVNGVRPTTLALAPLAGASTPASNGGSVFGKGQALGTSHDATRHTLSATATLSGSANTLSFDTFATVATFGAPDPFNADLSGGGLTTSIPIDMPPGPGGLTPPVNLSYSSASVSEQHNSLGAAGWAGEGWSMALGSITWAERNVTADCVSTCGNNWENSWQLSDPYGMGASLIPPNNGVSTYYDETNNTYFDGTSYYNMPSQWHTSAEGYAKIISYVGPNTIGTQAAKPPCFRVWRVNGIMEEFGCTPDSLSYYETPTGDRVSGWYLDLITDPHGNQIHITYQADTTLGFPRDVELSTIQYDSPGCHNANTACTGSAWAPLVQIAFNASYRPSRLTNTPANCNTGTWMRCDDPKDLSGSGGDPAPTVQTTYALNDLKVEVRTSGTGSWTSLRQYAFSYQQNGPVSHTDQTNGKQESDAGYFLLTQLQLIGADGTSTLPPRTFGYSYIQQRYEDNSERAWSGECGWSWNIQSDGTCPLWGINRDGNGNFLTSSSNGLGEQSTFTYVLGHNNTHGVNSGSVTDPTTCNSELVANTNCALADDENWSRVLLASRADSVRWITQAGQGGTQNTTPEDSQTNYTYALTYPLPAPQCSNCRQGMYWGNQNNGDYQDYYDSQFMGFAETDVTNLDGSVVKNHYLSTEGYGLYDSSVTCYAAPNACYLAPWWHTANAGHGRETEADYYDTNGTTLLKKTTASYNAVCPPVGVPATPAYQGVTWDGQLVAELDHNNPVAVC